MLEGRDEQWLYKVWVRLGPIASVVNGIVCVRNLGIRI